MILLEGELQNRKYTDKAGVECQITEVIVDRASFTGEKSGREAPPPPEEPPQYKKQEKVEKPADESKQLTAESFAGSTDDDYPF